MARKSLFVRNKILNVNSEDFAKTPAGKDLKNCLQDFDAEMKKYNATPRSNNEIVFDANSTDKNNQNQVKQTKSRRSSGSLHDDSVHKIETPGSPIHKVRSEIVPMVPMTTSDNPNLIIRKINEESRMKNYCCTTYELEELSSVESTSESNESFDEVGYHINEIEAFSDTPRSTDETFPKPLMSQLSVNELRVDVHDSSSGDSGIHSTNV